MVLFWLVTSRWPNMSMPLSLVGKVRRLLVGMVATNVDDASSGGALLVLVRLSLPARPTMAAHLWQFWLVLALRLVVLALPLGLDGSSTVHRRSLGRRISFAARCRC
jgi:hypothetical protein